VNANILTNNSPDWLTRTFSLRAGLAADVLETVILRLRQVRAIGTAFLTIWKLHEKHIFHTASEAEKGRMTVVKKAVHLIPTASYVCDKIIVNAVKIARQATIAQAAPPALEFSSDHTLFWGLLALSMPPDRLFTDMVNAMNAKAADEEKKNPSSFIDCASFIYKRNKDLKPDIESPKRGRDQRSPSKEIHPTRKSRRQRAREKAAAAAAATTEPDALGDLLATDGQGVTIHAAPPADGGGGGGGRGRGAGGRGRGGGGRGAFRGGRR
jgi:hypothetical protein